jgi:DNA-binding transcriptional LysR family regulator
MKLKHVEVFNAIMLSGSVSGAARLLHVTQPAITQTLQHAELQLGYALFTRQRNRLVPTAEAQALYPEVLKLVTQLESVRRLAKALHAGVKAELRLLVVPSLAVRALPDALRQFRHRYPQLPVSIRTLHSHDITEAIALREGDVGIVYGTTQHPSVQTLPIATGRLVCVSQAQVQAQAQVQVQVQVAAPRPRTGTRRSTVDLADVMRAGCIRINEHDPIGAMLAELCAHHDVASSEGITVQTHHIAMVLAEQGFGPAIIDSFTAAATTSDSLEVRTIVPEVPVSIQALIPQGGRSSKPAQDFIEAFKGVVD